MGDAGRRSAVIVLWDAKAWLPWGSSPTGG